MQKLDVGAPTSGLTVNKRLRELQVDTMCDRLGHVREANDTLQQYLERKTPEDIPLSITEDIILGSHMQWGEFNVPKLVEKHLENRIELSRQRNLETAEEQAKADLREFHKGSARTHPPLHWAAQYGLFDRISELLYAFEPVNEKSADGSTALHHAVHWSGSFGITKLLLEHGADPNEQRSKDGFAPLHELVSTSYKKDNDALQFVNKLVAHGADIHLEGFERRSVLGLAACQNLAGCVHRLIELGAHADSPFIMYSATGEFAPGGLRSALGIAAWHAHVETMKVLIEAGADVNYNGFGQTPLLEIVCNRGASKDPNRYVEGARMLLDAGADINATSRSGSYTPLGRAVFNGNLGLVKLLIERGADPAGIGGENDSMLSIARSGGQVEIKQYLETLLTTDHEQN